VADYWQENLREAAIEGLEFPVEGRSVSGGHEFGRHRYQGRPGQDTEPTGRAPLVIGLEIPLFADVDPGHYPILYTQLLAILTDDTIGGRVTYVDPVFGELPAQIVTFSVDESAGRRNGAIVKVTLEERSTDALNLTAPIVVARPGSRATAEGRRLDAALPSAGVFDEHLFSAFARGGYPLTGPELALPVGGVIAGLAAQTIGAFESAAMTVDYVRAQVDAMRARCDALLSLPQLAAAEAWEVRRSIVALCDAVERAGLDAVSRYGVEGSITLSASSTTAQSIAARVYGDPTRWPDVVAANGSIRNPLRIGRGEVRVFHPRRGSSAGLRA